MPLIILIGAPGSGKGSQADLLSDNLHYRKLSTGDALRRHVREDSKLCRENDLTRLMSTGELISDTVLLEVIKDELGTDYKENIILDGFPRTLKQAKMLASFEGHKVSKVVYLHVDTDVLKARISGRLVCPSCGSSYHVDNQKPKLEGSCDRCSSKLITRSDDAPEKVEVRLKAYNKQTQPVIDFYKTTPEFVEIDGNEDFNVIHKNIVSS
jgi:adenylate kinase